MFRAESFSQNKRPNVRKGGQALDGPGGGSTMPAPAKLGKGLMGHQLRFWAAFGPIPQLSLRFWDFLYCRLSTCIDVEY